MQLQYSISTLSLAVVILFSSPGSAQSKSSAKYLMAAMGDSITAGFLAATSIAPFNSSSAAFSPMDQPSPIDRPFPLNLAVSLLETRGTLSWATGQSITSQAVYLKNYLAQAEPGAQLDAINVAITGGTTTDLLSESAAIVTAMNSGQYASLKYVTLLIGNNDACQMNSDQNIQTDLHQAFAILSQIKQIEPIRILMSGLPRIPDLGLDPIKNSHTLAGMTCQQMQENVMKECLKLTSFTTQSQYETLSSYVVSRNNLLAAAAQQAMADFPNLQITFTDRLHQVSLSLDQLAVDCFHPNASAQAQISSELWNEQPWFH